MLESDFFTYLVRDRGLSPASAESSLSRCKRLERYEGDLDKLHERDGLGSLIASLVYSTEDESQGRKPRHHVPIKGNVRTGTASLKNAAVLYRDFRNGVTESSRPRARRPAGVSGNHTIPGNAESRRNERADWPEWPLPSHDDARILASLVARYTRFLDPEIVEALAKDNERHAPEWRSRLEACGVDPDLYLWEGSACAFLGVRRHSGTKEIEAFRHGSVEAASLSDAVKLDDNSYPKQLWAFLFTGWAFGKIGPNGYALAHLLDHKGGERFGREVVAANGSPCLRAVPGLFTAPSNTAYICKSLLDPTDFSSSLRALLQRRARSLYGDVCALLPPGYGLAPFEPDEWDVGEFEWCEPVGDLGRMEEFLAWRSMELDRLIDTYCRTNVWDV